MNTNSVQRTSAVKMLRELFPHGHPHYIPTLVRLMELHSDKNHDYARGGNPLGNFNRVANMLQQWPNFPYNTPEGVAFIYALKQIDAEAWTMCQGGECKVEGLRERTDDQLVYAGIRECIRQDTSGCDVPAPAEELSVTRIKDWHK